MKFSTRPAHEATTLIANDIGESLGDGRAVLWLTSGGSAIQLQVEIMDKLRHACANELAQLTILPVDERYGKYGHTDSNSAQMRQAGLNPGAAKWHDPLENNLSMSETVEYYSALAEDATAGADIIVATLGMGVDGHTAGLLPNSPAVKDTTSTVIGYSWSDYERLTLGIAILHKIDKAWLLAYGETKQSALDSLRDNTQEFTALPTKILYDITDVTVYNDYINT